MLRAARRAFQLRPGDPALVNNYAAALLIHRQTPAEILRLTLRARCQNPNSTPALINHSAALLLNERVDEAQALLGSIDTKKLTRTQRSLYHLDLFEVYLKLQRYEDARTVSDWIETQDLYPPQRRWFEHARQQLPPTVQRELTLLSPERNR